MQDVANFKKNTELHLKISTDLVSQSELTTVIDYYTNNGEIYENIKKMIKSFCHCFVMVFKVIWFFINFINHYITVKIILLGNGQVHLK